VVTDPEADVYGACEERRKLPAMGSGRGLLDLVDVLGTQETVRARALQDGDLVVVEPDPDPAVELVDGEPEDES